jgi:replicative DNA helicase
VIEQTILENLALNEKFNRKVLAFIKPEYFQEQSQKLVFSLINQHVNQYNTLPTRKSLAIDLQNSKDINQDTFNAALSIIKDSAIDTETDHQWLLDQTEQFCKDRALHNAIFKSISILNDSEKKLSKGAIPEIVSEALAVSFDTRIGHDYLEDAQLRYDLYHNPQKRLKFDVEILNEITRGGVNPKTLNLLLAPTGVGKSFWMCHFAATNLMQGKKVLYITLEMSEDQISKRIDANLLGIDIADIDAIPIKTYLAKINELKQRSPGKLIVREYPSLISVLVTIL